MSQTLGEPGLASIAPTAKLDADARIGPYAVVSERVEVGRHTVIGSGAMLMPDVVVENDVEIGAGAIIGAAGRNSAAPSADIIRTRIRTGAKIGSGSIITRGCVVGPNASVCAGALVLGDVPPNAIIDGSPGRIVGYVGEAGTLGGVNSKGLEGLTLNVSHDLGVSGCTAHQMRMVEDMRGNLTAGEFERQIPFIAKRYFMVFDVPSREVRGEHAHKQCQQFLLCIRGSCAILLDDGIKRREVLLDRPDIGVMMPSMIWGTQYKYSSDAILLVFASDHYDPDDYIRTYDEFIALKSMG